MALNDLIVPNAKLLTLLKAAKGKPRPCALATGRGPKAAGPLVLVLDKGGPAAAGEALKKASIKAGIAMGAPWLGHATFQAVTLGRSTVHFTLTMLPPENVQEQFARLLKPVKVSFGQVGRKKETEESVSLRFGETAVAELKKRSGLDVREQTLERIDKLANDLDNLGGLSWEAFLEKPEKLAEFGRQTAGKILEELAEERKLLVEGGKELTLFDGTVSYVNRFQNKNWTERVEKLAQSLLQDPRLPELRKRLSLAEAVRMRAAGIDFDDIEFDDLQDGRLDPKTPPTEIGRGGFNAPVLLTYATTNPKLRERVFKVEVDTLHSSPYLKGLAVFGLPIENARTGNRNIMSSRVAKRLGSPVIPRVRFGLHQGRLGLMMERAPGETAHTHARRVKKTGQKLRLSPAQLAGLLKQLNELEWCDALCDQVDRSAANYLVDFSDSGVKVTGIDNDISFRPGRSKQVYGPPLMDVGIRERIRALDYEKDLAPGGQGRLAPAELEDLANRVQLLKAEAQRLESSGCVVEDWTSWRITWKGKELTAAGFLALKKEGNQFAKDWADLLEV